MHSPKPPKAPVPPAPAPPPPTIDEAAQRSQEDTRLRLRRGRAATVLASNTGAGPQTATKMLTGG